MAETTASMEQQTDPREQRTQRVMAARAYQKTHLTEDTEEELLQTYAPVISQMVHRFAPLVRVAVDVDDLKNIASLALIQAAHGYDPGQGMSATWGDLDNDGRMDLYVSNMFSGAGHRITMQDHFLPNVAKDVRNRYQQLAEGNTLLMNSGEGIFAPASAAANVRVGRWAWGSATLDLNNDGLQDLVVANGFLTQEDSRDL